MNYENIVGSSLEEPINTCHPVLQFQYKYPPYSNYLGSPSPRGQAEGGWDMHPAMSSASAASEWRQFKASPEMQQFKSRNPEYFAAPATPESRERARRLL